MLKPNLMQNRWVRAERRLLSGVSVVAVALAALVLASTVLLQVAHVGDTYRVSHVTGAWFALAQYVNHGVIYPPLFNGSMFGGTRFMPLQFVLHAGLARITGEYLVSGKLYAYGTGLAAFVVLFFVLRRVARSTVIAVALVGAILATEVGLEAVTTFRGDVGPAALQLGAVSLIDRQGRKPVIVAGFLCALALVSKLNALWGAAAIVIWLLFRDRGRLAVFLVSYLAPLVLLLASFEFASDGRLSENIVHLSGTGSISPHELNHAAHKLVDLGRTYATSMAILLVAGLVGLVVAAVRRRLTIYHVAFVIACGVLIATLTDVGADWNHLIDVEFLAAVLVADLWRGTAALPAHTALAQSLILVIVGLATLASYQKVEVHDAVHALGTGHSATPLKGVLSDKDRVFSEDPYIAVSRGQDPVVLDPFMLLRIEKQHPRWQAALVRRIRRREFTKIVLMRKLDPADPWWSYGHLGRPVVSAIARNYRFSRTAPHYSFSSYWVYVPRRHRKHGS